ncbi:hypothetical protein [Herbaspirillum sp. GCM10030257]|uniref:hypothetical protein n=1 Tax=Herbaspirillum sp. GCM10030257 TaxID=3273393 RepID=UPI0036D3E82E
MAVLKTGEQRQARWCAERRAFFFTDTDRRCEQADIDEWITGSGLLPLVVVSTLHTVLLVTTPRYRLHHLEPGADVLKARLKCLQR